MKYALLIFAMLVTGCSYLNSENDAARSARMVESDRQKIYGDVVSLSLTVEDALEQALKYNLDAKIARYGFQSELNSAQLQKLNSLPDVKAQRDFINRSNNGASSSQSVLTGNQSLEPSFSADRSRRVDLLEANWDVLGAAINIYQSKSASDKAKIAEQRYRKIEQNVAMDVFSSFFRLAIAQEMKSSIDLTLVRADKAISSLEVAQKNGDLPLDKALSMQDALISKKMQLKSFLGQMSLAEIELKTLLSIPLNQALFLQVRENWADPKSVFLPSKGISVYVDEALNSRPEIREEFYNKNIAQRDVINSILQTIPGLSVITSLNRDSNSFLQDDDWFNFSATVTQSITRILTLPFRYKKTKSDQKLTDVKRHALIAAVISQVHISKSLLDEQYSNYNEAYKKFTLQEKIYRRSEISNDIGLVGGVEASLAELDFLIAQYNTYEKYSEVQSTLAGFVNTVGYDVKDFYNLTSLNKYSGELDE